MEYQFLYSPKKFMTIFKHWLKIWWKMCVYLGEYIDWFKKENKYKTQ